MLGYLCFSSTFHFLCMGTVGLLVCFNCNLKVLLLGDFNWSGLFCFCVNCGVHSACHWVDGSYPRKTVVCGLHLFVSGMSVPEL